MVPKSWKLVEFIWTQLHKFFRQELAAVSLCTSMHAPKVSSESLHQEYLP